MSNAVLLRPRSLRLTAQYRGHPLLLRFSAPVTVATSAFVMLERVLLDQKLLFWRSQALRPGDNNSNR
jgi:hypothetical protein